VNPYTEERIESFDVDDDARIDAVLNAAVAAARSWRQASVEQRVSLLHSLSAVLRRGVTDHAALITREMGKPITEARAEVEKCAFLCDYVGEKAASFLADEAAPSDSPSSFIAYEPLGVVLACMPWNFPFWQVFRCAAPAIAAGNCVVLKHANNVTRCGLAIARAFQDAGFPDGVFTMMTVPVEGVAPLIADPRIAAVSLTGSTAAGRSVGAVAGEHLKKCVLELGGSDAFVVLDDADVDAAATVAAKSRFQNAGQSCIAAKRFIVVERAAGAFTERLVDRARSIALGDPVVETTEMGPLAREDQVRRLGDQLHRSLVAGARIRSGGTAPDRRGFFFEPTVIDRCDVDTAAFTEETFGPLASVTAVRDESAALAVANHSQFGLGGNVWTRDVERGVRFARRVHSGGVFVNGMTHSDPRLPFGGVGESGYGRELHRFGMHEFVNVKTVWVPARD
jgi:succinate-semialdehyde dehydrogenase/glutarate-semialdehyde dehydrogenase